VYDNSDNAVTGMTDPIGHLTASRSFIGGSGTSGHAYVHQYGGFNAFGEPTSETITVPSTEDGLAGSYTIGHVYTANQGLPRRDVYPANGTLPAETVTTGYVTTQSQVELPDGLTGSASYTGTVDWNAFSQVQDSKLGGTSSSTEIDNAWDLHTGALTETKLVNNAVSTTPIDRTSYTYDPVGNPKTQTETRQGSAAETQCFDYDALDRLAQAWTATDACAADPTSNNGATVGSGITGGAYWTSWTLDPLGQRKSQTEHGLAGAGDKVTTYTRDGNGAGQPHTLTKASTTVPSGAATSTTMSYDKVGNASQRTTPDQGQQSLTWDDAGHLIAVTGASNGSSYVYDAEGALLLQKDPGTTTLYLPGRTTRAQHEQRADHRNTFLRTARRRRSRTHRIRLRLQLRTRRPARHRHSYRELNVHQPHVAAADPLRRAPGTTPTSWPDNHGFLNKPLDTATGLTDVGARWYDPNTGTFASLDPLFEAADSQQQNGYTYAGSNPITSSDPTGLNGCTISDGPGCRWTDQTGKQHNGRGVTTGPPADYCDTHLCGTPPPQGNNNPAYVPKPPVIIHFTPVYVFHPQSGEQAEAIFKYMVDTCSFGEDNSGERAQCAGYLGPCNDDVTCKIHQSWMYIAACSHFKGVCAKGASGKALAGAFAAAGAAFGPEGHGPEGEKFGPLALAARINPDELAMTRAVERHFKDVTKGRPARPYMNSTQVVREIMSGSEPRMDPHGVDGAIRWDTPGALNGREGYWELVVNTDTNTILHFNFVRKKSR
jgi:RHS repeat-associated protein